MALDKAEFQKALDDTNNPAAIAQEKALDKLKDQFSNMSREERREAFQMLVDHNNKSDTQLSINGDLYSHNFNVVASTTMKMLGGLFGSRNVERSSQGGSPAVEKTLQP